MAGIHFDITADSSGFVNAFKEVRSNMDQTSKVLQEIGKREDITTVEKQVTALARIIRDNEEQIQRFGKNIEKAMEGAAQALERGDVASMGAFSKSIETNSNAIAELNRETEQYRQTLDNIRNVTGSDLGSSSQVSAPMLFLNKEEYDQAERLRGKIQDIQEQIANFKGSDADLQVLRNSLSQNRDELMQVEVKAAQTAAQFGSLGSKLADSSTRFYALTDSVKEQIQEVERLKKEYNDAGVALEKALKGGNTEEISSAQQKYDLFGESVKNAELHLANLQRQQKDAGDEARNSSKEWTAFANVLRNIPGPVGNLARQLTSLSSEVKGATTSIKGMTMATDGAAASTLGLIAVPIIAFLAAVAAGYAAVETWMTRAEEGQDALSVASAKYGEVTEMLKDKVANVGEFIWVMFDNLTERILSFAGGLENVLSTLSSVEGSVLGFFSGKGDIMGNWGQKFSAIKNFFTSGKDMSPKEYFDSGTFKDSVKKLVSAFTPLDEMKAGWEAGGGLFKGLDDNMKKAEELANRTIKLRNKERQYAIEIQELENKRNELRIKMYDKSLSKEERAKALEEMRLAINEKYAKKTELATERLAIDTERKGMHLTDIEGNNENNRLRVELLRLEGQKNSELAFLTRMGNRLTSGGGGKDLRQLRKQQEDYVTLVTKQEIERERVLTDMEFNTSQAQINAMEDGTEKTLAQIQLDFEKQEEAIQRGYEDLRLKKIEQAKQLWEKNPANKGKEFDVNSIDTSYTELEQAYRNAKIQENEAKRKKAIDEVNKAETQAMYDYLKEYGSIQEQKRAISAEYDQKIQEEGNVYRRAALEAEKRHLLSELSLKEFQDSINWEDVFNNIGSHTTAYLEDLKVKLRNVLNSGDIDPENAKVLAEKIREIEDTISNKKDIISSLLPGLRERKRLVQETKEAEEELFKAQSEEAIASANVNLLRGEILQKLKSELPEEASRVLAESGIELKLSDITNENSQKILSALDKSSPLYTSLENLFKQLGLDIAKLSKAEENSNIKKSGLNALVDMLKGKGSLTDIFSWADGGPVEIIQGVNANVQGMAELVDTMGLGATEFGEGVHNFADGCNSFTSIIGDLASGNVFGAVNNAVQGFKAWGNIFNSGGAADKYYSEDMAALTTSNNLLRSSIDRLADQMNEGSFLEKEEAYNQRLRTLDQLSINTQEQLERALDDWQKENFWGEGHVDSAYQKIREGLLEEDKRRIDEILGKDIYTRFGLEDLSTEEMARLRREDSPLWTKILGLAQQGFRGEDAAKYLEEYANLWDMRSQAEEDRVKSITGITYDDLRSEFRSTLLNMEEDAEESSDKIAKIMTEALIDDSIEKKYKSRLQAVLNAMEEAVKEGDELRMSELRAEYGNLVNEAKEEAQNIRTMTGYEASSPDQSATASMADKATYDQFELYLGIATAQQIALEQGNYQRQDILNTLTSMQTLSSGRNEEFINLITIANGHLLEIKNSNKELLTSFNERMNDMYNLIDERL